MCRPNINETCLLVHGHTLSMGLAFPVAIPCIQMFTSGLPPTFKTDRSALTWLHMSGQRTNMVVSFELIILFQTKIVSVKQTSSQMASTLFPKRLTNFCEQTQNLCSLDRTILLKFYQYMVSTNYGETLDFRSQHQ